MSHFDRRMQLACDHWIAWPDDYETRADGWYAGQRCPHCRRKRAVVCASFAPLPAHYQAIEQRSEA
jgi:hypothetical protein